uniref:Uncharacterized protein n=1 Tax=Anguilla anguilla TaxID=7936 RepID=A0A0E9TZ27_ANGAN
MMIADPFPACMFCIVRFYYCAYGWCTRQGFSLGLKTFYPLKKEHSLGLGLIFVWKTRP